ncbi:hypothetical protein ACOJBO_10935 [Rhizobium beringeri]
MIEPGIDPAAPISTLKVAQRQIVEIARAPLDRARIIAMDEPTSSLTPSEFERLAEVITELSASGVSIIYVSHKMDEGPASASAQCHARRQVCRCGGCTDGFPSGCHHHDGGA